MTFDPFKPATWFNKPPDPNAPLEEQLVECPAHPGEMVTQSVAAEHVAAKQAEDEKKAAQAAEDQRLADERIAAAKATAAPELKVTEFAGHASTDPELATLPPPVPKTKAQETALSEIQKNQREHTFNQLKDVWQQILTPEEQNLYKGLENFPGMRPFGESNIVPNDPLKLKFRGKLGIIQVEAASDEDQFKFLEFINRPENRAYLPGGRFELNGQGKMSTDDYMAAVKNQKIINATPEQMALYAARDNVAVLESIPAEKRTQENIRDLGNAYEQEGDAIIAEYAARNGSLPKGVSVTPDVPGGITLNEWTINKGDGTAPVSYNDANGQSHTAQEIIDNPELMQQFSESITQPMVDSFLVDVKANPEEVQSLINLIGPTPEIYALLSKAHPELKDNGTVDEYFKLMRQKSGEGDDLSIPEQQVTTNPELYPAGVYDVPEPAFNYFEEWVKDAMAGRPNPYAEGGVMSDYAMGPNTPMWEVVMNLAGMGAMAAPVATVTPIATLSPKWLRTAFALGGFDVSGGGPEYVSQFIGKITEGIQKGVIKTIDFAKGMAEVLVRKGQPSEVIVKTLSEVPDITKADAEKIVIDAIENVNNPKVITKTQVTDVPPGTPFEPGMKKRADGTFVKAEKVNFRPIEPGDPIPEVGSPQRWDDPETGKTWVKLPQPGTPEWDAAMKTASETLAGPRRPAPSETAATAEKAVKPASGEKTAPAEGTTVPPEPVKPQGQAGEGQAAQPAAMSRDEIAAQVKAQYPDATPEQINAAVAAKEAKIARTSPAMAELDTKISAARARISERKAKGVGQRGAINDPEAKAYYDDHVELAKLYIQKGLKTVEEFAAEIGEKVDDFIRMVWDDANAAKGESDNLKAALGISEDAGHIPAGNRILSKTEQTTANDEIIKRIKAARDMLQERQAAVSELRGRQTAAGMEAKAAAGGGLKGYKAAGEAQRGEAEKVYTGLGETKFDEATVDWVINTPDRVYKENPAIFNKNRKGEYWTVRDAQEGLLALMKGETLPKGQLEHLEKVYGLEFIKTIKNTKKGLALDILAIPKSLMAFLDHSFPGRQGWIINSSNPEIFAKNLKDATASFWSEGYFNNLKQRVMSDPNFKIAKAWGVEFTDTGMDRVMREESYPSRILDKVPGMVQSNRSFTWSGNAQRLDAWNKYSKWLGTDATDAELKGLASFINKATGRGNLGNWTGLAEELNTILFSPKLFASRFQVPLMGVTTALSPRLRAIYWRNVGASIGVTVTTLGLLKGLSETPGLKDKIYVETDLRSSDIGKVIIGDTHIDLTGGNGQLIYLLARMAAGTRKSGGSNEYDTTAATELQRYLRYKGAPVASIGVDWAVGKDVMGEKFGTGKYWQGKIPMPMSIMDVYDAISISGLGGIGVLPLTTYGVGVNTYEQRAMTEEKRLGAPMYSDEQLMEATVKAKEKYTKPGASDPLGEKAVQITLDKLAEDKYTLSDYRAFLRTSGVPDYKTTKLQEYFNECIPLFDKWQKDEAVTGSKQTYSAAESAQAVFWGLDQTKGSSKSAAITKLRQLGLSEEFAPWLFGKTTTKATPAVKPTTPSSSTGRRFIP
jgi:hypothetical protein